MHELPYKPAGLRLLRRAFTFSLPANSEASFSQPATESLARPCGFVSLRRTVRAIVAVAPFVCHRCFRALRA